MWWRYAICLTPVVAAYVHTRSRSGVVVGICYWLPPFIITAALLPAPPVDPIARWCAVTVVKVMGIQWHVYSFYWCCSADATFSPGVDVVRCCVLLWAWTVGCWRATCPVLTPVPGPRYHFITRRLRHRATPTGIASIQYTVGDCTGSPGCGGELTPARVTVVLTTHTLELLSARTRSTFSGEK